MSRLATYDYRELGRLLRSRLESDGRGWRVCAADIGVCSSDLSRICGGQPVSAPKVIAVCDWLQVSFRGFYRAPDRVSGDAARSAGAPAAREADDMFHGKSTETDGGKHVR